MHIRAVDREFSVVVDTGPLGSRADIAPFVGIRHEATERLYSELLDIPLDEFVATVGANVGYVLGTGYRRWEPSSAPAEVLLAIESAVEKLRPFMRLEALEQAWAVTEVGGPGKPYRRVILALLRGASTAFVQSLREAEAQLCRHEDEVCAQFRGFSDRARARAFELFGSSLLN
jgi:hypothetical protein